MLHNFYKVALRNLWRNKWFSLINITGLAIGLTAGFLILLYVSFELSYDGFHSKGERIYRIVADVKTPSEVIQGNITPWALGPNLEPEFPEIESAVRVNELEALVRKDDLKFNEEEVIAADAGFFTTFDFNLLQGNKETALATPFTAVISKSTAEKYFGEEDPIGKTLKIFDEGHSVEITGVMEDIPVNSQIQAHIVLSIVTFSQQLYEGVDEQWGNFSPTTYILLAPNTDPGQLAAKFPAFMEEKAGSQMKESQMFVSLVMEPFEEVYLHSSRDASVKGSINNVYIFSMVAIFIILIACINFINLTTARSVERAKEVGIRKVVGAHQKHLAAQFIGESVIICFIAAIFTVGLVSLLLPYFNQMAGKTVAEGILSEPFYLLMMFLVAILLGLISGIYPALVLSSFRPVSVLKGKFSAGNRGVILRKGLVVSQFTISIILIIGTLVIYNQMQFMRTTDLGFDKEQIVVLRPNNNVAPEALQQAIHSIPEVKATSFGSSVPGGNNYAAYSEIENKNGDFQIANLAVYFVDFDYVPTFDIELVAGRPFSRDFASDTTQAMLINESTAKLLGYASAEDALGRNFRQWGREGEIVGVVKDFHITSLQQEIEPLTMRIETDRTSLLAVKIDPKNVTRTISSIEEVWNKMLPQQPFDYYFLDEFFDRQYRSEQQFGTLFLNFAILAIFISCLGLLGLASYSTLQRRREIGIRKIIGASVSGIVNLLSVEFLKLVLIAFLIASPLAWFLMDKWLQDFAYRITISWWVFAVAGAAAILIALLTVSFQAVKAAITNPINSLRTE